MPALSYLAQYEHLIKKSQEDKLSTAELVLLEKLDLAELHQFQLQRDLSIELLKQWLTRYKFKDWTVTESSNTPVTQEMKEERAKDIAKKLSDHTRWLTHDGELTCRRCRMNSSSRLMTLVRTPS